MLNHCDPNVTSVSLELEVSEQAYSLLTKVSALGYTWGDFIERAIALQALQLNNPDLPELSEQVQTLATGIYLQKTFGGQQL